MMQLRNALAQRFLYFLTHERMSVTEDISDKIYSARIDREYLIVRFDAQLQAREIAAHLIENIMQLCFRRRQHNNVVGIAEIVFDFQCLFHIVVEIRQI